MTFSNWTQLDKQTRGMTLTIEMAGCHWFVEVRKSELRKTYAAMKAAGQEKLFAGRITPIKNAIAKVSFYE